MPSTRVHPIGSAPNYKRIAVVGAASASAAVSDPSDANYIYRVRPESPLARFMLAAPVIPAGYDVATIVAGAQIKQLTARAPRLVTLALSIGGQPQWDGASTLPPVSRYDSWRYTYPWTLNGPCVRAGTQTATAYTFTTPAGQGSDQAPNGPWSAVLDRLAIRVDDGHPYWDPGVALIYELFADVYYASRPSVTLATDPATPITSTCHPTLTATFAALVESWQDNSGAPARTEVAYELHVFSAAQYLAAGFDPATSPSVWGTAGLSSPMDYVDGVTLSTETVEAAPDRPLPNGTYRVYARGRRLFAAAGFGDWGYAEFTIDIQPTPPPTISASLETADARVAIEATSVSGVGATNPRLIVERSADNGATWTTLRGADFTPAAFGAPLTLHDYEAPRGAALTYRAACLADFSDISLLSDYASAVAAGGSLPVDGWNIKAPLDPALNLLGAPVLKDPQWSQDEQATTFRPVGRRYPVVVSLSLGGADGSMTLAAATDAMWAALEALREYRGTLLVESPFGWSRYVRITARSWSETGAGASTRRHLTISYLEVEAP